jgi:lysyl-tRNA synthetase class 2
MRALRDFFQEEGFLEIETPILLDSPLAEAHIEALKAENGFLRTSHEPMMKACLAAAYDKIFEIGPCFRKEEIGRFHREEFTMLEWYQTAASSDDLITFTKKLFLKVAVATVGKTVIQFGHYQVDLSCDWEIIYLKDAFAKFAGIDIYDSIAKDRFEIDLIEKIEVNLPKDRPCILRGYPAEFRAYAKLDANDPSIADRWELYIAGFELANAYGELNDKIEMNKIISESFKKRKKMNMREYVRNQVFDDAIACGIPDSAGCALGLDRLLMFLTDAQTIDDSKI